MFRFPRFSRDSLRHYFHAMADLNPWSHALVTVRIIRNTAAVLVASFVVFHYLPFWLFVWIKPLVSLAALAVVLWTAYTSYKSELDELGDE